MVADPGGRALDLLRERDRERLDLAGLLGVAIGLAMALGHFHQRGLIENVLIDDTGHV